MVVLLTKLQIKLEVQALLIKALKVEMVLEQIQQQMVMLVQVVEAQALLV